MSIGSAHIYSGGHFRYAILNNYALQYFNGSIWVAVPGATGNGNNSIRTEPGVHQSNHRPTLSHPIRRTTPSILKSIALFAPTDDGSPVPIGTGVDFNVAKLRQYEYSSVSGTNYPRLAFDGYTNAELGLGQR